jgi:hypothetical protein
MTVIITYAILALCLLGAIIAICPNFITHILQALDPSRNYYDDD